MLSAAARRVLSHFREIAEERVGVLLITHDLELALEAAAEDFRREELLRHPYSRALYRAMPEHGFTPVQGTQPFAGEAEMPQAVPGEAEMPQAMPGEVGERV